MQSSCSGSIAHILFSLPASEARQFSVVYCSLIDALPVETRITIVAEHCAIPIARRWILQWSAHRAVQIVDAGRDVRLTPWVRDGQLAITSGQPSLLKSRSNKREDDGRVADLLHRSAICQTTHARFDFEGGNLLLSEDYLIVGADTVNKMDGETDVEKLFRLSSAFAEFDPRQRQIISINSRIPVPVEETFTSSLDGRPWNEQAYFGNSKGTCQPLFHIDMFLSFAGKTADGRQRILVGDPALAAHLLNEQVHPFAMANHFDAIADDLRLSGLEVIRNPMALIYMDRSDETKRIWYHATSNNVLVQESHDCGNIVWLPQFGHDNWPELHRIDAYNQLLWESFGYEVRLIPKCQLLAENLGGIHCMTNVLARK